MKHYWWIAAIVILGGCKNPDSPLPYPLTVSEQGLGPVHIGESFDIPLLRGKLPGFELEKLSEVASGSGQTILRLKRHDIPIALILSDSKGAVIHEVVILSPLVKNVQGIGIDDTLNPPGNFLCDQETCRNSDLSSLTYRIKPGTRIIREITVQQL